MATQIVRPRRITVAGDEMVWFDLPPEARAGFDVEDWWLESDLGDDWRVAYRLMPGPGGTAIISEIRLLPRDDWPGREPGQWRADRLGLNAPQLSGKRQGRRGTRASFAPLRGGITRRLLRCVNTWVVPEQRPQRAAAATPRLESRGPKAWPDARYARIARDYVAAFSRGSRRPVADVAARHGLTNAQIRDAISRARELELLTPPPIQGKPGGQLTARALALLRRKTKR